MPTFNSLDKLFVHLKQDINKVLEKEMANMVKDKMTEHVKTDVYEVYNVKPPWQEPYRYKRRYENGGLGDRDNMTHTVNDGELEVTNVAKAKEDSSIDNLAGLIEYGDNAGYGEYEYKTNRDDTAYQYLRPRPFIANTRQEIQDKSLHVKAMKDGLKALNYDVK